jgi:hypothetical protein
MKRVKEESNSEEDIKEKETGDTSQNEDDQQNLDQDLFDLLNN